MSMPPAIDFGARSGPAICVVGSLNADLVAYESDSWIPGSYNVGTGFELAAGGKGLNVAMSVAATGLPTYLVGRVGDDIFGRFLIDALAAGSVNQEFVSMDPWASTGVGHVRVGAGRDYDTCVIPGANDRVSADDITAALTHGVGFSHLVLSFEIPTPTVIDTAARFAARGSQVVVNYSPVAEGSRAVMPHTDVVVVNEAEAGALFLQMADPVNEPPADLAATMDLLRTWGGGPRDVVVTLGAQGVCAMSRTGEIRRYRAHDVTTMSAVGAGDSFLAMLVSRVGQGDNFLDGLALAGAAGALACSRRQSWLSPGDAQALNHMVQDSVQDLELMREGAS